MRAFAAHVGTGLRLNLRNRMALIYGYIFPLLFLLSFWIIYRHDPVPIVLHLGALLTVTALGGACFGLPTTLVAERERGVWRRYRATPTGTATLVASTIATRTILLLSAAALQLALAFALGMPMPLHPFGLVIAFLCASVAFLALGMVIAGVANSVPAVQALGQCIFLPMLMIGGVAVPLQSLPDWTLALSAFFPGRFAVEAIQHCVTGAGLAGSARPIAVLLAMAAAAGLAAIGAFRWDPAQPLPVKRRAGWFAAALALWFGTAAWTLGAGTPAPEAPAESLTAPQVARPTPPPALPGLADPAPEPEPLPTLAATPQQQAVQEPDAAAPAIGPAERWQDVTPADFHRIAFDRLPADTGVVNPWAARGEQPAGLIADQLATAREGLGAWAPAQVADPVQRTRNYLFVAAVPDLLQMEQLERFLPALVFDRLQQEFASDDLAKILYWIAMHPQEGDDAAVRQLEPLGLPPTSGPTRTARARSMVYALKMLGRLTGDLPGSASSQK